MFCIYRARSVPKASSGINKATIVQFTNGREFLRTYTTCVSSYRIGSAQKSGSVCLTKWQRKYWALPLTPTSVLRGVRVMATIKKRINNNYVNYNASELEVLDEVFSL